MNLDFPMRLTGAMDTGSIINQYTVPGGSCMRLMGPYDTASLMRSYGPQNAIGYGGMGGMGMGMMGSPMAGNMGMAAMGAVAAAALMQEEQNRQSQQQNQWNNQPQNQQQNQWGSQPQNQQQNQWGNQPQNQQQNQWGSQPQNQWNNPSSQQGQALSTPTPSNNQLNPTVNGMNSGSQPQAWNAPAANQPQAWNAPSANQPQNQWGSQPQNQQQNQWGSQPQNQQQNQWGSQPQNQQQNQWGSQQRNMPSMQSAAPQMQQPSAPKTTAPTLPTGGSVLMRGQKTSLGAGLRKLKIGLRWDVRDQRCDLDASAFLLTGSEKVPGDEWFVFYGQDQSPDNSTKYRGYDIGGSDMTIDLTKVRPDIEKIALAVTIYEAIAQRLNFSMVNSVKASLINEETNQVIASLDLTDCSAVVTALVVGEIYRYKGEWKFNAVGSGVSRDLAGFCGMYGVNLE